MYICLHTCTLHGLTGPPTIKQSSRKFFFWQKWPLEQAGKENKCLLLTQSRYSELNYSIFPCHSWLHFTSDWGDFYFKEGVEIALDGRHDLNVRWYHSGNSSWRCFSDRQGCWQMRQRSVSEWNLSPWRKYLDRKCSTKIWYSLTIRNLLDIVTSTHMLFRQLWHIAFDWLQIL